MHSLTHVESNQENSFCRIAVKAGVLHVGTHSEILDGLMQLAVQHVHTADCSAILLAISSAKKKLGPEVDLSLNMAAPWVCTLSFYGPRIIFSASILVFKHGNHGYYLLQLSSL